MFKYRPVSKQLREVQKQNVQLKDQVEQNRADLDFVAAMVDVEIPEEEDQKGAE